MIPSKRQETVYNEWQTTNNNILINAVAGSGKEQPIWCKVQTPNGSVEIGKLIENDIIFGSDGKEQKVIGVFPQGVKDYYKITFRDGSFTHCGLEHLWTINNFGKKGNSIKVLSLSEIINRSITKTCGNFKFRIPLCQPIEYGSFDVKINPYVLGLLIGDGSMNNQTPCISFNAEDLDIVNECKNLLPDIDFKIRNTSKNGLQTTLISNNKEFSNSTNWLKKYLLELKLCVLSGDKFIPDIYLKNSIENRKLLLQGLMDSDGTCQKNRTSFHSTSKQLILDMIELVNSLGGTAIETKVDIRENRTDCYRLNIKTFFCPFNVSKKKNNWKLSLKNGPSRYITKIEKIGSCEQICIKVSNENQLYLTDNFIVTHNTSTLLKIVELCDARTLFLSFNKSIQEEIQSKIDTKGLKQGKAITLHSLGLSSLKTNYKYTVNNSKNYDLIKELQSSEKSYFKHLKWEDKLKITYVLMDMNDASRLFLTNDIDKINKYLLVMDKVIMKESDIKNMWEKLIIIRDKSYENKTMQIDFIDMLYVPIIKDLYIPINPTYLLLDECQDFSLLQHKLVKKLIEQGTVKKFIAVGDRNQAIYSFSGAFSSSFDYFLDYPNTIELQLDICYRCPTKVIDIANDIYDVMQYFTADEGVVAEIDEVIHIKDNSMIICRNSKPLIDLYFQLISNGKSVYIKGDDILNNLIRFLKPYVKHNCFYAKTEMQYKLDTLLRDTTDSGKIQSYYFKETFEQFKMLMQYFAKNNEKVDVVINKLNDLFVDKKDAIMLCTIHKSKGLEADIVYILQENLIPSKFAKSAEQLIQENNLKYVARTRAKKELYFLNI